ncbi:hypothetical protein EX30DRAFT_373145 [Ascodesmis nigricans]|uniref:Uncharacterized protein n=1 Tax=Ascodesmis nigricans TaxID=341454 RepID=A0A4S2MQ99_9PEZI|nr:hypothetical protein EX30DRAFT_373145 [Ascodesmis nigricans]
MAPGGQVEIAGYKHTLDWFLCDDGTIPADSAYHKYMGAVGPCCKKLGVNSTLHGEDYQELLEKAEFVDVRVYIFKIPFGTWA